MTAEHDHEHVHSHDHGTTPAAGGAHAGHGHGEGASERQLLVAVLLTGGFMAVEVAGGLIAQSLALLADAAHMVTDAASLAMAFAAVRAARRPATAALTYGHHRWQVLAAFVNGLGLLLLAAWILVEAAQRLREPPQVQGGIVSVIAFIGLFVNLAAFKVLSSGERNLNVRGALAHVAGDLMGSVAALVAGGVILATGWMPIDPILSALVALLMLRSGWGIARESAHILLEGAPADVDPQQIESALRAAVPQLAGIHHLHVWSLTDNRPIMTLHAVLAENADPEQSIARIQHELETRFKVRHVTIQVERSACASTDDEACAPAAAARRPPGER